MKTGQVVIVNLIDGSTIVRRVVEVKGSFIALCSLLEYAKAKQEQRVPMVQDFPAAIVDGAAGSLARYRSTAS